MSYNSFKRALGETNLERKCRFLFGFCLLVLIAGSFWWYGHRTEELVYAQSQNNAQYLVDAVMLELHWKAEKLETDATRTGGFIEKIAHALQTHTYISRVIVPNTDDPEKKPHTDRETEVLNQFLHSHPSDATPAAKPEWQADRVNGGRDYQYFQAVRYTDTCFQCHGPTSKNAVYGISGLPAPAATPAAGDLAAVVKVIMPDADTQTALNQNRAIFITTALVTVFLAMIALYVVVRYVIVKPLKHLRDVSDEVSRGNIEARAEIHTGDEFEELGSAFNKMLRHLGAVQNELRSVNTNLDTKVDELAQANMRLYELNRLKSDFLATMSHELRTPLNSIIGFSDVLNSIQTLDDKQKRYVQNIQKSGRVLLDMINDILDLAKIESGKMELRLSEFRIEDAISAQCDMARPLSERKNIDLEVVVEPNLPELFQDQGKLQQVLNNLLSNAIKFTPEGGRIVVSARRDASWHDQDQLVLTVADTGVGIAEEDQVAIFEKFRQGKTSLAGGDAMTREYSGTGLGLSIVKELCKLMGGEVSLTSELGKGSTFTVRLPWARADQPRMDSPLAENIDELLRPRRVELQRSLDRPVPAAPTAEMT
jgi:two-component system sensor histidine kinase BarA